MLPPGGTVDWEVELVVVIGRTTVGVTRERAWDAVAGRHGWPGRSRSE